MNKRLMTNDLNFEEGPEECLWESDLYSKSYFKNRKHKKYLYYDTACFIKFFFFHWLTKWVNNATYEHLKPYKLHPLPIGDQILKWQPIFSKHVSDGLVRLEEYETSKSLPGKKKAKKPYRSLLFRALFLTIWKRALVVMIGLIVVNVLSMSISILVKKLVVKLGDKSIKVYHTVGLLVAIIACQIADGLILENISFYTYRLITIVQYLISFGIFHHALCYRRKFSNNVNGTNTLNVCNQVLHSCSPDSECSKNPLYCQALRYQTKEINPKVFYFESKDSFYFSQSFNAIKIFIEFATNFGYGIFLLARQIKMKMWVLYIVGIVFTFLMIFVELLSTITIKCVLYLRDYKMTKCNYMFPYLSLIKKMFYDDIAVNIITQCRNNELSMIVINIFLTFLNLTMFSSCINVSFYIIQYAFVKSVRGVSVVTDIDTAGFMASFYIFLKIAISMFMVPRAIKVCGVAFVSFKRFEEYVRECAPNFYISDNKFVPSTNMKSNVVQVTNQLPNDVVVYYKNATFAWVNTRHDLLNKKYEPLLRNVNFELKRGQVAIVTGSQGSGKSNFVKSMLGEMTLVGGSMAVVPLHTSMPIFYASQDIFLQQGTIRSNITFGHRFDEQLYNAVLKAVELDYDISTWEKGDLRVVSENAHSLSGGQRVRMELARAVYAYLVFHKVNKDYNNSKCSFLMCLDASFHGLDPFVSKTIFNNLFNLKTGLLVKDDLSVVLTTSKQCLDLCSKTSDVGQFPDCPIYNLKDESLKFYSGLHNFIKNNRLDNIDYNYLSPNIGFCNIYLLSNDMFNLCSGLTSKPVRMELTRKKYNESFKSHSDDDFSGVKCNPYKAYLSPCLGFFVIYILINIIVSVMDNIKYVLSTRLSDYISKHITDFKNGQFVDFSEVKTHSTFWLRLMTLFISVIIVLSILSTILFSILSNIISRKIHEYVIDSIFKNSSSVIKLKKRANQVMTYLSCDTSIIDDDVGYISLLFLSCSIQAITSVVTLFYLIPISIPFFIVTLSVLYKFIVVTFANSAKNKQMAMLESMSQINSLCENAISGSSVYRSYKNEHSLLIDLFESTDYKVRTRFLYKLISTWCSLIFKYVFSVTTFIVLVIPIVLDKYTKYKMKVGYFALALSLCMNLAESFAKFSTIFAKIKIYTCSLKRFTHFIPPGQKLKFGKFVNAHEEYIVSPTSNGMNRVNKNQLLRRRAIEFKNENKKFYALRRLFYHPKISIVDVVNYVYAEHTGVELKDVCVYTTPVHNPESMILKHLTVSAHKSEIIGMVGRTGAGKSTLLSVLHNIAENRTGQVLLDGKDMNDIPKDVLRQIIGVLPQLPFVFKGWTVRRFLDPRRLFTDDEINQALNKCALLNFVNELPGGRKLDTPIVPDNLWLASNKSKNVNFRSNKIEKERSMSIDSNKTSFETDMIISNSQLRTLTLARLVLYRDFYRVIIVDEPPKEDLSEEVGKKSGDLGVQIYDILQKQFSNCTTFLTAHNTSVLKKCTSVWVMHEGSIVKTCKTSDIAANESIASIIEQNVKNN